MNEYLPTPSEISDSLKEALIDALIFARDSGVGDGTAWYDFAVEALAKAGYDEYGDKL